MNTNITLRTTFSISTVLRTGWKIFKTRPWFFVWLTVIMLVIGILPNVATFSHDALSGIYLDIIYSIAILLLSFAIQIGVARIYLDSVRNDRPTLSLLTDIDIQTVAKFFLVLILAGILTILGYLLFIIPGIIISLSFMLLTFTFVEHAEKSVSAILQIAWDTTKGVRWQLFGFALVFVATSILGLVTLGLGFLVIVPVFGLAQAVIYDTLQTGNSESVDPSQSAS